MHLNVGNSDRDRTGASAPSGDVLTATSLLIHEYLGPPSAGTGPSERQMATSLANEFDQRERRLQQGLCKSRNPGPGTDPTPYIQVGRQRDRTC